MKYIKHILLLAIILIAVSISKVYATTGTVTADGVNVRKGPSLDDEIIETLNATAEVEIIGESGEWYKIRYNVNTTFEGYMHKNYIKINNGGTATDNPTPVPTQTPEPTPTPSAPETPIIEQPKVDLLGEKTLSSEAKVYILPVVTSSVKDTIGKNTKVTVLEIAGNYAYINYSNKNGWVRSSLLQEATTQTTSTTTTGRTAYVCVSQAIVRKSATTESEKITTLTYNDEVTIIGEEGNFYKIRLNNNEYYMAKHLIANTKQPTTTSRSSTSRETTTVPNTTETPKTEPTSQVQQTVAKSSVGDKMVQMAKSYVGYKYVYGGSNPSTGFDCSGLVYYICGKLGYSVNRTADNQIYNGVAVDKANLQPGDLVFFTNYKTNKGIGHVGIYIGNNQFVHASTPTTGVIVSSLGEASYVNRYVGARRIGI